MFGDAVFRPGLKLVKIPSRLGDANNRAGQFPVAGQLLQRGKNLFVREIAGSTKKHHGVRVGE